MKMIKNYNILSLLENIMNIKNKINTLENLAKGLAITGVACAIIATSGSLIAKTISEPLHKDLNSALQSAEIHKSENFQEYLNEKSKMLYDKLNNNEISYYEFNIQFSELMSTKTLEQYALQSTNPKVQEVIANFNEEQTKYKKDKKVGDTLMSSGLIGATTTIGTGLALQSWIEKKRAELRKRQNIQQKWLMEENQSLAFKEPDIDYTSEK